MRDITISQLLIPVRDMSTALRFYEEQVGLRLKFRDGDRYAALDGGHITIGLLGPGENVAGPEVSAGIRVADLRGVAEELSTGLSQEIEVGPDELRLVIRDSDGHPWVISQKL